MVRRKGLKESHGRYLSCRSQKKIDNHNRYLGDAFEHNFLAGVGGEGVSEI